VNVEIEVSGATVTLDMASTGMLQVIQIIAYACFYNPPLILLDEPDAHLHADSQSKLYDALRSVSTETQTRILFASHSPQLIQRLMYDSEAAILWVSEGERVPLNEAQRPSIPLLMTLGALTLGAEAFDAARPLIVLTEDKLIRPSKALAIANGAPANIVVISYNGCGNLPAARLLASMITDIRDDCRVIVHRDRDFRTDAEITFELSTAAAERERNGISRVTELFTHLNDVEHSFAQEAHLKSVIAELPADIVDAAISDIIAFHRDALVDAARTARAQIKSSLYDVPRKRAKPEWAASGMPDAAPPIQQFIPVNGLVPVAFEHSHGKKLMNYLRPKLHQLVGGSTQALDGRIYAASDHLASAMWKAEFEQEV